jgi:hypothetical protein
VAVIFLVVGLDIQILGEGGSPLRRLTIRRRTRSQIRCLARSRPWG